MTDQRFLKGESRLFPVLFSNVQQRKTDVPCLYISHTEQLRVHHKAWHGHDMKAF